MGRAVPRWALVAAVVAIGLVGALLVALQWSSETVASGHHLRPYDSGVVYEMRIADAVTIYVDEESKRIGADLVSGLVLTALATAAAMTLLLLLAAATAPRRLLTFYGVAALGLGFLAVDELGAVHETVGHNLPFLADLPGVERPDDVIYALYVVPALAFVVYFRHTLAESPLAWRLFVASVVLYLLSGLLDLLGWTLDEPVEILVEIAIASGFVALMATHLMRYLHLSPAREERVRVGAGADG